MIARRGAGAGSWRSSSTTRCSSATTSSRRAAPTGPRRSP